MGRRKKLDGSSSPQFSPASNPEERENQMISLAVNLAEQQLREGTASSQVIVHYLKLASTRNKLEEEKIKYETAMLQAKKDALNKSGQLQELMANALEAFRSYSGNSGEGEASDGR
jgi:hypothetical protein